MTMTLNKKEMRNRSYRFMKKFADAHSGTGLPKDFIRAMWDGLGFVHKRLVIFEQGVKTLGSKRGRIDGRYLIAWLTRSEDWNAAYGYQGEPMHRTAPRQP